MQKDSNRSGIVMKIFPTHSFQNYDDFVPNVPMLTLDLKKKSWKPNLNCDKTNYYSYDMIKTKQ